MLIKRVGFYEEMPRGYRVFRFDYLRHESLCAPIGIHWLCMWGYRLWARTFMYRVTYLERLQGRVGTLEWKNERLRDENERLRKAEHNPAMFCEWTYDEGGPWETGCGRAWEFMEDGVTENVVKYCPFCGGRVTEPKADGGNDAN